MASPQIRAQEVSIGPVGLQGILSLPQDPCGIVIFAHGSGSGRFSPRNNYVAERLNAGGIATLLLDLLTPAEERDRRNVFDIALLATRLDMAAHWTRENLDTADLPIGYFGASTGGGAALRAAAESTLKIAAVVSRGGRPDLAGSALARVKAPTMLIVGSNDEVVLDLNMKALDQLNCEKALEIVFGASHLFEEPGTLDVVVNIALDWFQRYLHKAKEGAA